MSIGKLVGIGLIAAGVGIKLLEGDEGAEASAPPSPSGAPGTPATSPAQPEGEQPPVKLRRNRPGYKKYEARGAKLFIGMTGSGKSYYLQHTFIPAVLADGRDLVLIHDPWEDYEGRVWPSVEAFRSSSEPWPRVNVFRSEEIHPRDIARLAIELGKRFGLRVVLVIDELTDVCSPHAFLDGEKVPRGERVPLTPLEHVIRKGRHYGVELVGTAQRPADLPTQLRSQTWYAWVFALSEPSDFKWIEAAFGSQFAQRVRAIDPAKHEHVYFDRARALQAVAPQQLDWRK